MSELKRSVWGPALWTFLHTSAASLDSPEAYVQLLRSLVLTLPCPECRQHVQDFLQLQPPEPAIHDAASASRYLFEFHNGVNSRLGKPLAEPRLLHARYGVLLPEAVRPPRRYERIKPYRML